MRTLKINKIILSAFLILFRIVAVAQDVPGPAKNDSGKWGFKNKSGTVVVDYIYDAAMTFSNDMAAVKKSGLWGYINVSGELVVKCEYDDAWFFTDGLAAVKSYDKWGYINKKGEVVIKPQFSDAAEFVDGLAWVKQDGKLGYINTSGETVIPFVYKAGVSFSNGYALAYRDSGWGVIDEKGTPMAGAATFIFDDARPFSKSMAPVYSKSLGKWGLVGTDGILKVDFSFSSPEIDRTTTAFGWAYATTSYANKDKVSLAKAVTLIESSYLTTSEKQLMIPYYEMLGEKDKIASIKKAARDAEKAAKASSRSVRSSESSADFSLAIAPVKVALYSAGKFSFRQIPVTAQLRIGTVGIGARYNMIDGYQDRYRFGALVYSNQDSLLTCKGAEYSFLLKFFDKYDISRGYKGYGHSGNYWGLEFRYADLKANDILTDVYDENSIQLNLYPVPVSPLIKRYDLSMLFGYSNSRKFWYFDTGFNLGVGYKTHDFGETWGVKGYTYSDERLSNGWNPVYFVMRYYIRVGINLF